VAPLHGRTRSVNVTRLMAAAAKCAFIGIFSAHL
jgi:hypothetical protein